MLGIFSLRRRLITVATTLVFIVTLAVAQPAYGIINGIPDGTRHPNAGLMAVTYPGGSSYCSGFLISPQYFATAAHCIYFPLRDGATAATFRVTFDEKYATAKTWYQAAAVSYDPKFVQSFANSSGNSVTNDFGLIKLTKAVKGITPANLPPLNYTTTLPTGKPILETAGYGITNYAAARPSLRQPVTTRYSRSPTAASPITTSFSTSPSNTPESASVIRAARLT